jgi:trehalose 6-phosphate synthase/phosphatase
MSKLIIVSNRLPINIVKKNNKIQFQPSVGGVATGLSSVCNSNKCLWIGWPGITVDKLQNQQKKIESKLKSKKFHPVFLSRNDINNYYYGFCNKTIWPQFHYFTQYTSYNNNYWSSYKRVNEAFCEEVLKVANEDDIIWVQDYHLFLLPMLIRKKLPNVKIGFFLHIPFPSFEIFRLLPWREEILKGILGADLVGFHTYDYIRHFLHTVSRLLGYDHKFGHIKYENHNVSVDTFPMGIDYEKFVQASNEPGVQKELKKIRNNVGDRKIILSIDRLDYTKGILPRLEAFDQFLEKYPEYKEKVTLILVAVPSRTRVDHYQILKKSIEESVSGVNGKHGTIGWTPVWYLYRYISQENLAALYNISDIGLITPLRDGMNLMAKEFIATKRDEKGVLILSEMAGAATELGEALIVNPNNIEEIATAMYKALKMPCKEQVRRNRIMQRRIQRHTVQSWANDFIEKLSKIKEPIRSAPAKPLTTELKNQLLHDYINSNDRLIMLDYDGTLVPFTNNPELAEPGAELLKMLNNLAYEQKNEIIIVSGRDRNTLENWFGKVNIGLVAEHGAWYKEKRGNWKTIEPLVNDWKDEIRPIFEMFNERTPGSFIEEKDFSLVWHYRAANKKLGAIRALELKDALMDLTSNRNLEVLEGNKVIEVRNSDVHKGRVALKWISKNVWDYILAIGDDVSDEDIFAVLPESAYSIKVGQNASKAKFNLESVFDINKLLKLLENS